MVWQKLLITTVIVIMIILLGRGVSLPNAIDGIRLYWGEFNGSQLAGGALWQAATGQVCK